MSGLLLVNNYYKLLNVSTELSVTFGLKSRVCMIDS